MTTTKNIQAKEVMSQSVLDVQIEVLMNLIEESGADLKLTDEQAKYIAKGFYDNLQCMRDADHMAFFGSGTKEKRCEKCESLKKEISAFEKQMWGIRVNAGRRMGIDPACVWVEPDGDIYGRPR